MFVSMSMFIMARHSPPSLGSAPQLRESQRLAGRCRRKYAFDWSGYPASHIRWVKNHSFSPVSESESESEKQGKLL